MADGPDDSGCHEGCAHQPGDAVDHARQKQIPMKTRTLLEVALWLRENELADILFNEDEDEEKKGNGSADEDDPHRKGCVHTQWVDDPAPVVGIGGRDALRNGKLVCVSVFDEVVNEHHYNYGNWYAKVTNGTTELKVE